MNFKYSVSCLLVILLICMTENEKNEAGVNVKYIKSMGIKQYERIIQRRRKLNVRVDSDYMVRLLLLAGDIELNPGKNYT